MLGNEPNQGRVISRNHSMKSKLGTVRVWTRAVEGLAELRTQALGGPLVTYVPVRVCFGIEVVLGCCALGALALAVPALAP